LRLGDGQFVVGVPTEFVKEWLATRNIRMDVELQSWLMPRLQEASSYLTGNMGWFLASGFFSAFSIVMTLVCSFYFLLDNQRLWAGVSRLLPPPAALTLEYFRIELDKSLNNYFRGQVINASVVLVASMIAFSVLGMEYGIVGGLVWGTCEIIPMFGTYIGVGVCLILAFLQGGGIVWKVLLAAIIIQQIKDNFIAPRVMSHTMGLHPVVIILAVLTGAKLAGFLGILLAIPLTAVAVATLRVYLMPEANPEPRPDLNPQATPQPPPITTVLQSGAE
jgi:predicted PurR-regulated permease PerM